MSHTIPAPSHTPGAAPGSILVVGSSNTDMVVKTKALPGPGQTVLGGAFFMNSGGKGANQAVAAARLQGIANGQGKAAGPETEGTARSKVTFITKLGTDIFGAQTKEQLIKEGIDPRYILADAKAPSGVALITVDEKGENSIVVAPGANAHLSADDIEAAHDAIEAAAIILVQLEIPLETVTALVGRAVIHNKPVILNPAPARSLPEELLRQITILTPNEKEAELLTGIPVSDIASATAAANALQKRGVQTVIITLGKNGALVHSDTTSIHLPAPPVDALDTTAAGDVFNGALATALAENKSMREAAVFANYAAALSVTRLGAQSSAPTKAEVEAFMQARP